MKCVGIELGSNGRQLKNLWKLGSLLSILFLLACTKAWTPSVFSGWQESSAELGGSTYPASASISLAANLQSLLGGEAPILSAVQFSRPERLAEADADGIKNWVEKTKADPNQFKLVRDLLDAKKYGAQPQSRVQVAHRIFYVSRIFHSPSGRELAILYTEGVKALIVPRLIYRSLSGGSWRSAPFLLMHNYVKGEHYTQSTKLRKEMVMHLDSQDKTSHLMADEVVEEVEGLFDRYSQLRAEQALGVSGALLSYDEEARVYADGGLLSVVQECQPGRCFKCNPKNDGFSGNCNLTSMKSFDGPGFDTFTQYLREVVNPGLTDPKLAKFLPNFAEKPTWTYMGSHSLLSPKQELHSSQRSQPSKRSASRAGSLQKDVELQVYPAQLGDRKVEWHMAQDREGRMWIDQIRFADGEPTTYCTDAETIDSGILTNKALEYTIQSWGLEAGSESVETENSQYSDITPLLKNLFPIQAWRAALGREELKQGRRLQERR